MAQNRLILGLLGVAVLLQTACSPGNAPDREKLAPAAQASAASPTGDPFAPPLATNNVDTTLGFDTSQAKVSPPKVKAGELLVKFKSSGAHRNAMTAAQTVTVRAYDSVPNLKLVRLREDSSMDDAVRSLRANGEVEYVEPNYIYRAQATPNDPQFSEQWSLNNSGIANIRTIAAWDTTTGNSNVVIAVLDSGVDYTHVDLSANIFSNTADCDNDGVDDDNNGFADDCHGIDTYNGDSDPMDDNGHGTHVAGIIGASGNDGYGMTGVAWNVKILPCKFMDAAGNGSAADAIACLDYITELKARGINIIAVNGSFGEGSYSRALYDAIERQMQRGILFVAPAGEGTNGGVFELADSISYAAGSFFPCAYTLPNVICVMASNDADQIAPLSNVGDHTVHVVAPGHNILSTLPRNAYGLRSGTSMAAPHVAGVLALIQSAHPTMDWRAIKNTVIASGDFSTNSPQLPDFGWGHTISRRRINAQRALACSNSQVTNRVEPKSVNPITNQVIGVPLRLSVLNIDCANPAGAVSVTINPGNVVVPLRDDGVGADKAASDGVYTATWTPQSAGTYSLSFPGLVYVPGSGPGTGITADILSVEVVPFLKAGFPVRSLHHYMSEDNNAITTVANLNGGSDLEIIAGGSSSTPTYAWNATGSALPGWPLSGVGASVGLNNVSVGNLLGNSSQLQIVSGSGLSSATEAYSGAGSLLAGWPRGQASQSSYPPTLVDIDGDGIDEVFVGGSDYYLFGFRSDGTLLPGFPVRPGLIPGQGLMGQYVPSPLAADMDADGRPELILALEDYGRSAMVVLNADGTYHKPPMVTTSPVYPFALGDVDGDGQVEIIALGSEADGTGTQRARLLVMNASGLVKRSIQFAPDDNFLSGGALADMNGDGIPEMVLVYSHTDTYYQRTDNFITLIDGQGATLPGWPHQLTWVAAPSSSVSAPAVGDVDGDNLPDVVVVGQGGLHAFRRDGTYLAGLPTPLSTEFIYATGSGVRMPVIADIDGDGRNEIVVTTNRQSYPGYFNKVFVYDLNGAASSLPIEWGQWRGNTRRHASYQTGLTLVNDVYLAVMAKGTGTITSAPAAINCGATCLTRKAKGSVLQLTATPSSGGTFDGWSGACAGQGNPCTITLSAYTATRANFRQYDLNVVVAGAPGTVTSTPSGISCPTDCTETLSPTTMLVLTAAPTADTMFTGWTGACTGTALVCNITMDAAKSVTATFTYKPQLRVQISQGYGEVALSPISANCTGLCSYYIDLNAVVTLTATPTGNALVQWEGDCSSFGFSPTCTVTMDSAKSARVMFPTTAFLSVAKSGDGFGSVDSLPTGLDCTTTYCYGSFTPHATITLTATPNSDSLFIGWSDMCSGTATTCTVVMDQSRYVTANFKLKPRLTVALAGSGIGTVTSNPAGIACGSDCTEIVDPGTVVTLTAAPASDATFEGWSGGCTGATLTCTVTMDVAKTVTATFIQKPLLTVTLSGPGTGSVNSSPPGIACAGDCTERYPINSVVTLTALANSNATFVGWVGACPGTIATCSVTMDVARTVTATFQLKQGLNVALQGPGTGSVTSNPVGIACGSDCTELYDYNALIALTAAAATDSTFVGWSGACTGSAATCNVTMNAARSVTATFQLKQTLNVALQGSGTVTSNPAGINCGADCTETYDYARLVVLTATGTVDASFVGWSGACTGTSTTCNVTMSAARSVTATFAPKIALSVALDGSGTGSVNSSPGGISCGSDCSELYGTGSVIILYATPAQDSAFTGWSGACAGFGSICNVTMLTAQTVTATFSLKPALTITLSGTGSGSVLSNPAGITCGPTCSSRFDQNSVVTLTATPSAGSVFSGWSGACTGTSTNCAVVMSSASNVTAGFSPTPAPPPAASNSGGGGKMQWPLIAALAILFSQRRRQWRRYAAYAQRPYAENKSAKRWLAGGL